MSETVNVFILAAGRGERLRPISEHIPKPLMPILGKPILEGVLERADALSYDGIGMNLHYKREVMEDWVKGSDRWKRIRLFPEDPVLGTGGALKNAEEFLRGKPFLVHNSDIVSDIDLNKLVGFHLKSGNIATLAVHDFAKFNNLFINSDGIFRMIGVGHRIPDRSLLRVAFTGIAVYSPGFLRFIPRGVSSVVDAWEKAASAGYRVGAFDVSGCSWSDIGSPSSYASMVYERLRSDGENVYIHPQVYGCSSPEIQGFIVLEEGCIVGRSSFLKNCVVLPGGHTKDGGRYENCIIGPGFKIDMNEKEMIGSFAESSGILIGTGGSDRKYYRTKGGSGPVVLMQCRKDDEDFDRHIEYARFFFQSSVPVPELVSVDNEKMIAEFEDLGDMTLYGWLKCPREAVEIEEIYRKVLDVAVQIHHIVAKNISGCQILRKRIFDYDHFRWETSYFVERFVRGIKKRDIEHEQELDGEFHGLASKADAFPKTIVHRDFQSQNIMITGGRVLRVIDFQGARMGPPAYDVASMLWDPYYRLNTDMRDRLLRYFVGQRTLHGGDFNGEHFSESLIYCRLQRHMQALGAYGYLSKIKGKRYFLKHVPEALRLLKEDISIARDEFPVLNDLILALE